MKDEEALTLSDVDLLPPAEEQLTLPPQPECISAVTGLSDRSLPNCTSGSDGLGPGG